MIDLDIHIRREAPVGRRRFVIYIYILQKIFDLFEIFETARLDYAMQGILPVVIFLQEWLDKNAK